jgi:cob(I)alamin adenosyltransferase
LEFRREAVALLKSSGKTVPRLASEGLARHRGDDRRAGGAIDRLLAEHPLRPAFVVPGATAPSAALDLARTFLRRAERRLVAARRDGLALNPALPVYLNRSSDLAYVLARRAAAGVEEPLSHT